MRGACPPPQAAGTAAATQSENARRKKLEIVTMRCSSQISSPTCSPLALPRDNGGRPGRRIIVVVIPTIRQARSEADFQRLRVLFEEYEADLPPDLRHGAVPAYGELMQAFAGRSGAFLARIGEEDVGCVAVRGFDPESAHLRHLFVAPRRRGLGAARSLMTTAIDFARAQRYARILLDTEKARLEPAYLLYRSLGFEEREPFGTVTYESPTFMVLKLGLADDRI